MYFLFANCSMDSSSNSGDFLFESVGYENLITKIKEGLTDYTYYDSYTIFDTFENLKYVFKTKFDEILERDWINLESPEIEKITNDFIRVNLFKKSYEAEELADFMRDWHESLDKRFNPVAEQMPETDEHGFNKGRYVISIIYTEENENV